MSSDDLGELSMLDLFRIETESQVQVLTDGLLALERTPTDAAHLEACMRAAHSVKGAARIVDRPASVTVAHAMEDCFVAAQHGKLTLRQSQIDHLLRGVDLLFRIAKASEEEAAEWLGGKKGEIDEFVKGVAAVMSGEEPPNAVQKREEPPRVQVAAPKPAPVESKVAAKDEPKPEPAATPEASARVLRVTADNLNRLLALAGESLVESRRLKPFADSLLRLKRLQNDLGRTLDDLRAALPPTLSETAAAAQSEAQQRLAESRALLAERLTELDQFDRRSANLSHRLYDEALAVRMRPFADGVHGYPRLVRDVARSLGRQARLEVKGETTEVDRDILEKLEAPLTHLLRNAVDHGIESPEERRAAGKPEEGTVLLEARHSAGLLQIIVSDDGRGVDWPKLRDTVVKRKLTNAETAARLSESELLEFLFLPGFTLRTEVTEISGRGVGLDVVQNMVKQVRGTVRVSTQPGQGMKFTLQLPLTLSVMRTLLADIAGEPYAFPLAHIVRTMRLSRDRIELLEGRQHFKLNDRQVGLVAAAQLLGADKAAAASEEIPVVVIGDHHHIYGLAVDRFLGERELVVQPLDRRLGKVKDIAAAGLMEDGAPVLIVDAEDLIRSVEKMVSGGRIGNVQAGGASAAEKRRKRVLVVDDSLTVRELERKLLASAGYTVEIAVDGMDGWNAARSGRFDLVVTDVDMPRMDGIELVTLIKRDVNLKSLPVMIVSYKDREQDRQRGLEAGADYYLTKGSFHDETLLQAVVDLIGTADA